LVYRSLRQRSSIRFIGRAISNGTPTTEAEEDVDATGAYPTDHALLDIVTMKAVDKATTTVRYTTMLGYAGHFAAESGNLG